MAKIAQVIALCALMALSTDARSVRALRQTGGGRHLQTTIADTSKSFEVRGGLVVQCEGLVPGGVGLRVPFSTC